MRYNNFSFLFVICNYLNVVAFDSLSFILGNRLLVVNGLKIVKRFKIRFHCENVEMWTKVAHIFFICIHTQENMDGGWAIMKAANNSYRFFYALILFFEVTKGLADLVFCGYFSSNLTRSVWTCDHYYNNLQI